MSEGPIPPGFGPLLVSARGVPESKRVLALLTLIGSCAALVLFGRLRGIDWSWSIGIGVATFAALYVANFGPRMRAGEGWFAMNNSFVRTDMLSKLRARGTLTGLFVEMTDADGRELYVALPYLEDDPKIWDLVLAGVRMSTSRGLLVADNITARVFGVAAPPKRATIHGEAKNALNGGRL
jgi:hypothetical protein